MLAMHTLELGKDPLKLSGIFQLSKVYLGKGVG
jgi:hypothetical protein